VIFCLDKFQGLIQMKDAATAQSAKLVNNLDSKKENIDFRVFLEFKWSKHLQWLLYITNRFF